jgi:predicted 3-demethylubiquinone-9 3-methyltransferase (glyoxalase superfamily)
VEFEIEGQEFVALNRGPIFKFNEAISFQVYCETQEKWIIIDRNFPRAVMKKHSNAVGSRTNTGSHGKSFPQF